MRRFTEFYSTTFLTEAYLCEGPPAPGNQLFHKDLGIPPPLAAGPAVGLKLSYGYHAPERAAEKGIATLPQSVPAGYQLIEVESSRGRAVKWVVRFAYDNVEDLVMVIVPSGFVKTIWKNRRSDRHSTLQRSLYTAPNAFKV